MNVNIYLFIYYNALPCEWGFTTKTQFHCLHSHKPWERSHHLMFDCAEYAFGTGLVSQIEKRCMGGEGRVGREVQLHLLF